MARPIPIIRFVTGATKNNGPTHEFANQSMVLVYDEKNQNLENQLMKEVDGFLKSRTETDGTGLDTLRKGK